MDVELAGVLTDDQRFLVLPKDNAQAAFDAAKDHDAIMFWLRGPTTYPQPVLLPRARCGLRRPLA